MPICDRQYGSGRVRANERNIRIYKKKCVEKLRESKIIKVRRQ